MVVLEYEPPSCQCYQASVRATQSEPALNNRKCELCAHYGKPAKTRLVDDFEAAYDKEKWLRLVIALVILCSCAVFNPLAVVILNDIAPRTALPDAIFALVPEQRWARTTGDIMVGVVAILMLCYALLHRYRMILIRRISLIQGLLYILRILVLASTPLPVSYTNVTASCVPAVKHPNASLLWHRLLSKFVQFGTSDPNTLDLCGDMLYSGHTTVFTTAIVLCTWYMPRSLRIVKWVTVPVCVFGMVCLIISRVHYTVDVLIGYWMTMGLYTLYHGLCLVPHEQRRHSAFRILFITKLFAWMEQPVPAGWLPNRLSCPCLPALDAVLRRLSDPIPLPQEDMS